MARYWQSDVPMGYRLSGGTQLRISELTDANYYALAICVLVGKTSEEALRAMGLSTHAGGPVKGAKPKKKSKYLFREVVELNFTQ